MFAEVHDQNLFHAALSKVDFPLCEEFLLKSITDTVNNHINCLIKKIGDSVAQL